MDRVAVIRRGAVDAERRKKQLGLLALFVLLAAAVCAALVAERLSGAEVGEPCTQGGLFPCRSARFNSARCLYGADDLGHCTQTCDDVSQCPTGWSCEVAAWGDSPSARAEYVCVRPL